MDPVRNSEDFFFMTYAFSSCFMREKYKVRKIFSETFMLEKIRNKTKSFIDKDFYVSEHSLSFSRKKRAILVAGMGLNPPPSFVDISAKNMFFY